MEMSKHRSGEGEKKEGGSSKKYEDGARKERGIEKKNGSILQ